LKYKSDVEILDQLLYDDLLFGPPTGEVITKQMDLQTHKSISIVLKEINSSIDSMHLIDEKLAVTLILPIQ